MKVTRSEEKRFNVLVDPIKESVDERKNESKLNYYYQRLDTQDLVVAGRIGDVECNYQLLADLGMQALLSIYCAKGKDIDQVSLRKKWRIWDSIVFSHIKILLNWKFGGMHSQMILQMMKWKASGQPIEICQNLKYLRKGMFYYNEM